MGGASGSSKFKMRNGDEVTIEFLKEWDVMVQTGKLDDKAKLTIPIGASVRAKVLERNDEYVKLEFKGMYSYKYFDSCAVEAYWRQKYHKKLEIRQKYHDELYKNLVKREIMFTRDQCRYEAIKVITNHGRTGHKAYRETSPLPEVQFREYYKQKKEMARRI